MPSLVPILAAAALLAAAPAQNLTGFPFQNETLRYSIRWPTGVSLGEAVFSAQKSSGGWAFETALDAAVPGFAVRDSYKSTATAELCSIDFDRSYSHGSKKTRERTTFDQQNHRARRATLVPPSDGKSEFDIPPCAKDAVSFVYLVRREMGQGRVAPAQTAWFGSGYSVSLRYTGEVTLKAGVADHVIASVKGPGSSFTVEIDFARDAARTPLTIKVPLAIGNVTAELVR